MFPESDRKAPSSTAIQVLHLEDDVRDRELVRMMLEGSEVRCAFTYAANASEFEQALSARPFDLILSDFTLPAYSGTRALAHAQAKYPDIPYVFVSGTIGEERAIESLKNGATDYVLKHRLERLLPAMQRALGQGRERARRREAEAALRASEQRFREMAENIGEIFWIATPHAERWLYLSSAAELIWGRPLTELYSRHALWREAMDLEDRRRLEAAVASLAESSEYRLEYRIRRPDGTLRWLEDRGYPIRGASGEIERIVGVATDITERKSLEVQLHQSQKMEAIGQLAGGIAHDFNNLLTVINGRAALALSSTGLSAETRDDLAQIAQAGERAAGLTRQLLLFSRKQTMVRRPLDLNRVIGESTRLFARLIGEHITVEMQLEPQLPVISADSTMIEQIVMNLAINARDAMPKGGRLILSTSTLTLSDSHRPHPLEARAGRYVKFSVRDSGCGIPEEILPRIFEPFFTTKEVGKGTGLGLATVFGIARQHDGWVDVQSTVGSGSEFDVYFPATQGSEGLAEIPAAANTTERGSETILLVEDEKAVREFAALVLTRRGYKVLEATSSVDALETWSTHADHVSLILTDIVMPDGVSGLDLAAKLQAEKPGLRVICTSGYSSEMLRQFSLLPGFHFIHKPYSPPALLAIVREVLDK